MPELHLQISQKEKRELDRVISESGLTLRDWMREQLALPDHAASEQLQREERAREMQARLESMRIMRP